MPIETQPYADYPKPDTVSHHNIKLSEIDPELAQKVAEILKKNAGYHSWHAPPLESGETSGETYGCFRVYWDNEAPKPGWYWAGVRSSKDNTSLEEDPNSAGPFATSTLAMLDADEYHPDNLDD